MPWRGRKADDALEQLGAAGADQAAEAEDLAAPQAEGGILHDSPARPCRARVRTHLVGGGLRLLRIELGHVAPDHQAGHLERLEALDVAGRDMASVAQHRDAVGDRLHLVQAVGDVEDRHALGAQRRMISNRLSASIGRENGRRLVEGHDLVRHQQRAGDLHELPVGDGEAAAPRGPGRCAVPSSSQDGARPLAHGRVVDEAEAPDLAPEEQVLRHRQVLGEQDLLVNENDALALRIDRAREGDRLAVRDEELPFVGARWPERMRIRVDLPAPFSPMTAWTSPGFRSSEMPLRTSMGPKDFEMFSARRTESMNCSG